MIRKLWIVTLAAAFCLPGVAQTAAKKLPAHAKVFLAPMNGFEADLKTAIQAKKVPVELVAERDKADFEITGTSETQKAGTAKKVIMLDWHSNEQASITVSNIKSGEVVFAYSVNKQSSAHGKRSTAEACAKHLKEQIEGK
jgi:DNA-binding transcriptional regulator LsrR (DeoR family)